MNYVILSDYFSYVSNFKFHNFIILKYDKVIYLDKPKYTNNYRKISQISQSISTKTRYFQIQCQILTTILKYYFQRHPPTFMAFEFYIIFLIILKWMHLYKGVIYF